MKFGRIVLQVNIHQLKGGFSCP